MGRMEPDKPRDSPNRFPKAPKMPPEVQSDPARRRLWNEYWDRAQREWGDHLRDQRNRDTLGDNSEILRGGRKGRG